MPCSGNSAEYCGAGDLLNVYWSGAQPPAAPITVQNVGNWTSLGCYKYVVLWLLDFYSDDPLVVIRPPTEPCHMALPLLGV